MGRDKSDKPTPEALRQRRYRDRKSLRAMGMFPGDMSGTQADDATNDPASDAIAPPGLIHARRAYDGPEMPTDPGGTASLEEEQALWVRRRRQITELQLEKQRGDLIPILEARQQMAGLGRRIRSSLDRIKNSLPPHLSSEMRPICERAIAEAVAVALEELRSVEA